MAEQLKILLAFFLEGFIVGILFDLFRVTRKCYKTPNFLIYIEDVLFWLLTGFLTLMVIYVFTDGQMRLYMILTLILGSIFYFLTISKYFVKINTYILKFINKILKLFTFPITKLHQIIKKHLKFKKSLKK